MGIFSKNLKAKEVEKQIDLDPNQKYKDFDVLRHTVNLFKAEFEREKLLQQQQEQFFYPSAMNITNGGNNHNHTNDCKKRDSLIPKKARPKEAVFDISKLEKGMAIIPSLMTRSEYKESMSREEVLKREKRLKRPEVSDKDRGMSKEEVLKREKRLKRPVDEGEECNVAQKRVKRVDIGSKVVRFEDSDYDCELDLQIKRAKKSSRTNISSDNKKSKSKNKKSSGGELRKIAIPNPPPELPDEFLSIIIAMGGKDVKLVITKRLTATDCTNSHGRLSMPFSQIAEFLFEEEKVYLQKRTESGGKTGIPVKLIQPNFEETDIIMRQWDMNKINGCSKTYVLAKPWNDVVWNNGFKEGDAIQVWSFRMGEELGLVIVRLHDGKRPEGVGQLPHVEGQSNVGQLPYGEGPSNVGQLSYGEGPSNAGQLLNGEGPLNAGQLPYGEGPSNVGQLSNGEEPVADVGELQSGEESGHVGQLKNDQESMDVSQSSRTA